MRMRFKPWLLLAISCMLASLFGCEKDDPGDFEVEIRLVDQKGIRKSLFTENDSLIFEFYFSNHTGYDATYLRPCGEFAHFLKIYKEDSEGIYQFIGQPEYYCAAVAVYLNIKDMETILLSRFHWRGDIGCPEIGPGKYYVGDTLSLRIESQNYDFVERIYFEIQ